MMLRLDNIKWLILAFALLSAGCASLQGQKQTGIDERYQAISRGIADVVDATDRAFGEPRVEDRAEIVRAKVGGMLTFSEGGEMKLQGKTSGRFPLPALRRRMNIFLEFEGDAETTGTYEDLIPSSVPEDKTYEASAGFLSMFGDHYSYGTKIGLKWDDGPRTSVTPFMRMEFRMDPWRYYLQQEVYYDTENLFGEKSGGHIDYLAGRNSFLRFYSSADKHQDLEGLDLEHAIVYRLPFYAGSILSLEGWIIYNYAGEDDGVSIIRARWIGRIWKSWLEYEIRPQMSYPWSGDDNVEFELALALNVIFEAGLRLGENR